MLVHIREKIWKSLLQHFNVDLLFLRKYLLVNLGNPYIFESISNLRGILERVKFTPDRIIRLVRLIC
jgi:hypothetical protein